jgi:hypothetical protein
MSVQYNKTLPEPLEAAEMSVQYNKTLPEPLEAAELNVATSELPQEFLKTSMLSIQYGETQPEPLENPRLNIAYNEISPEIPGGLNLDVAYNKKPLDFSENLNLDVSRKNSAQVTSESPVDFLPKTKEKKVFNDIPKDFVPITSSVIVPTNVWNENSFQNPNLNEQEKELKIITPPASDAITSVRNLLKAKEERIQLITPVTKRAEEINLENSSKNVKIPPAPSIEIASPSVREPAPAVTIASGWNKEKNQISSNAEVKALVKPVINLPRLTGARREHEVIPSVVWNEMKAQNIMPMKTKAENISISNASSPSSVVSGDTNNVVNNVTVQSTNPTQAASDMLVSLTKVKRRRYS